MGIPLTVMCYKKLNKQKSRNFSSSPPVHISPALCGKFVWSETAWPGSQSVPLSCLRRPLQWLLRPLQQLPTRRLSPGRPRPPPAACCPIASAEDLEAPPPGHHGYWALRRTGEDDVRALILNSPVYTDVQNDWAARIILRLRKSLNSSLLSELPEIWPSI